MLLKAAPQPRQLLLLDTPAVGSHRLSRCADSASLSYQARFAKRLFSWE